MKLTLITDRCALPLEDVLVVVKNQSEELNQATRQMEIRYFVEVLLKTNPNPVAIMCKNEEERDSIFEYLLEKKEVK